MSEDGKELAVVPPGYVVVAQSAVEQQSIDLARTRRRAWDAERELSRAQEQRDRLGDRLKQLEEILASHFARSVRMLSGAQKQFGASQDATRAVAALEDHLRALRLLNSRGVDCERVEHGVRQLLDERDRVVEVPTDFPPPVEIVTVVVQEPEVVDRLALAYSKDAAQHEVAGTYSLTNIEYNDGPREGEKLKLGDAEATFHLGKIPALPSKS